MAGLMGRGRTHAVANYNLEARTTDELERDIQDEIAEKMNLGMDMNDLQAVEDRIDGRQITRPDDINVACSEKHGRGDRAECVVAVDDVPWF